MGRSKHKVRRDGDVGDSKFGWAGLSGGPEQSGGVFDQVGARGLGGDPVDVLDHDPQQRFRSRRPNDDPPVVTEPLLDLGNVRRKNRCGVRVAGGQRNVAQQLLAPWS